MEERPLRERRLIGRNKAALRRGFERGQTEYGECELAFTLFTDGVIDRAISRAPRELNAALYVRAWLSRAHFADLYLAIACEAGHDAAWHTFLVRLGPGLKRMLAGRGAPAGEADELVGNLPGDLVSPPGRDGHTTRLATYDGQGALFAWTGAILIRRFADRHRKARPESTAEIRAVDPGIGPDARAEETEAIEAIQQALRRSCENLIVTERLALKLKFCEGLTQRAIATILGITESSVSRMISEALAKIRHALATRVEHDEPERLWKEISHRVEGFLQDPSPDATTR